MCRSVSEWCGRAVAARLLRRNRPTEVGRKEPGRNRPLGRNQKLSQTNTPYKSHHLYAGASYPSTNIIVPKICFARGKVATQAFH